MKKYFHKLQSKITICILTFVIIPVIAINLLLQLQRQNYCNEKRHRGDHGKVRKQDSQMQSHRKIKKFKNFSIL